MYYELIKSLDNSIIPKCLSNIPMEVSFIAGRMVDVKLDSLLRFSVEKMPGRRLPDYMTTGGMLVFSSRLVEMLNTAGVNNLQLFPAVIVINNSNTVAEDYFVANIIGVISCADMARSEFTEIMPGLYEFSHLAIELAQTKGQKLFRLAEANRKTLIHEDVIQYIISNPLSPELFGFDLRELEQA
jgi:hypothetical protein